MASMDINKAMAEATAAEMAGDGEVRTIRLHISFRVGPEAPEFISCRDCHKKS